MVNITIWSLLDYFSLFVILVEFCLLEGAALLLRVFICFFHVEETGLCLFHLGFVLVHFFLLELFCLRVFAHLV